MGTTEPVDDDVRGEADLAGRARAALVTIAASRKGDRIAIVTHLGIVQSLMGEIDLPNAGFRVMGARDVTTTTDC